MPSQRLRQRYLKDRYHRVIVNNSYSLWSLVRHGIPQNSILGPILFNIFLCDLFFLVYSVDIASYADDNTLCAIGKSNSKMKTN